MEYVHESTNTWSYMTSCVSKFNQVRILLKPDSAFFPTSIQSFPSEDNNCVIRIRDYTTPQICYFSYNKNIIGTRAIPWGIPICTAEVALSSFHIFTLWALVFKWYSMSSHNTISNKTEVFPSWWFFGKVKIVSPLELTN